MDRVSEINFAKLQIAKKMLKKGMDIDTIIELTGLTKKDLEEIS